eukprot:TRINITY_DN927_c1_g1_i1.p1 TRINITY_DN927_c1_g1~~TRINITY_DN927_c1_g1_i1.p1  ORF type:complete len:305 (+),score=109.15 TRINITY_DN927_c1_g1_i1:648-1562(+)
MSKPGQLGSFLESYLESIDSLPHELKRNFTLMRELDSRLENLLEEVEVFSKQVLKAGKKITIEDEQIIQMIKQDYKSCLDYSDEKVALALQTYEMVDKNIRRLDMELKKYETELGEQPTNSILPLMNGTTRKSNINLNGSGNLSNSNYDNDNNTHSYKNKYQNNNSTDINDINNSQNNSKVNHDLNYSSENRYQSNYEITHQQNKSFKKINSRRLPYDKNSRRRLSDSVGAARVLSIDCDMPIDPNEPTYCICNRVSFGQMIECENTECKVDWFHFECVGLTDIPKGKWLCPECRKLNQKKIKM